MHNSRILLVSFALLLPGCGRDGNSLTAPLRSFDVVSENGFSVSLLLIRPAEGSATSMFGVLHLLIGTPPNPIVPPSPVVPPSPICALPAVQVPGELLLCGHLRNPAGETLETAVLTVTIGGVTEVVSMDFDTPPSPIEPCGTVFVQARALLSLPVEISPGPPTIIAVLTTSAGELIGINPGPPEVSPGPPDNPACTVRRTER